MGLSAMRHADDILAMGRELTGGMNDRPTRRSLRLCVGITDVEPKLIAYKILEPTTEYGLAFPLFEGVNHILGVKFHFFQMYLFELLIL
jgi:LysR family transcriptional activator of nhaA